MAIDDKLFRIFEEAQATGHRSRADLARAVSAKRLSEFSYERKGERHFLTWGTVLSYVLLLVDYEMIGQDQRPVIQTSRISRKGFDLTLGEKVELYATRHGFSVDRIRSATAELLGRKPARLPSPNSVYTILQLPINYTAFHHAISVRAFQQRVSIYPKQKSVIFISDILVE